MTTYLYDLAIDFDAQTDYEASDIEGLKNQIESALAKAEGRKVAVVVKNAHYLTTRAFYMLYKYTREPNCDVVLVPVESDKSSIFSPPGNQLKYEAETGKLHQSQQASV